jgi:hypothetical protein
MAQLHTLLKSLHHQLAREERAFAKAKGKGNSIDTRIETRTRRDGVVQAYHVSNVANADPVETVTQSTPAQRKIIAARMSSLRPMSNQWRNLGLAGGGEASIVQMANEYRTEAQGYDAAYHRQQAAQHAAQDDGIYGAHRQAAQAHEQAARQIEGGSHDAGWHHAQAMAASARAAGRHASYF